MIEGRLNIHYYGSNMYLIHYNLFLNQRRTRVDCPLGSATTGRRSNSSLPSRREGRLHTLQSSHLLTAFCRHAVFRNSRYFCILTRKGKEAETESIFWVWSAGEGGVGWRLAGSSTGASHLLASTMGGLWGGYTYLLIYTAEDIL